MSVFGLERQSLQPPPSANSSSAASASSSVSALLLPPGFSTSTAISSSSPLSTVAFSASAIPVVEHNPYALVLALIPMLTIFGNSMVILAVRREKSLQTVTNYLIVSLASADLLVATCVMFFAVYFEWNSFVWDLGPTLCNLYIGADVACSTASILNLLAISIDRYIAISHPLAYCQIGTKNSRAYLSIALVWSFSIAVAVPVAFGANHIEQENDCSFTNPVFMIGSSVLSFFVPCLAMIALYAVIFRRLREREKARDMRKRGPTLGVDNALILNALMGGARMARQIAKSHLKDQLLLELSMQTSSFPSPSEEEDDEEGEEDEEEEEDEPDESEANFRGRHKISYQISSSQHKSSAATADRRPTYCLMLNGGTGCPFPLAPMNPLTLPRSGMNGMKKKGGEEEDFVGKRRQSRRNSRRRRSAHRGTTLLLRRCNTLPTAVLRRPNLRMMRGEGGNNGRKGEEPKADATHEKGPLQMRRAMMRTTAGGGGECPMEMNNNQVEFPLGVDDAPPKTLSHIIGEGCPEGMLMLNEEEEEEEEEEETMMMMTMMMRPCSENASQFSLRDCSPFWHEDELSTQRSFGDGLQEEMPFIDSPSQTPNSCISSSSSSSSNGSTKTSSSSSSSIDDRKWSAMSAMTDPMASRWRQRPTALEAPIRAHSTYCGWPTAAGEQRQTITGEGGGKEEDDQARIGQEVGKEEDVDGHEWQGNYGQQQIQRNEATMPMDMLPKTLIHLASPVLPNAPPIVRTPNIIGHLCPINNISTQPSSSQTSPYRPIAVRRLSTVVRPPNHRSLLICASSGPFQSLPNLLNDSSGMEVSPIAKEIVQEEANERADGKRMEEMEGRGEKEEEGRENEWIRKMLMKRKEEARREAAAFAENSSVGRQSGSIGNRSIRVGNNGGGDGGPTAIMGETHHFPSSSTTNTSGFPQHQPNQQFADEPNSTTPSTQQRNGSCQRSAKSSSHQSPLQRIRNAFRRSLLAAMDEKRRPSRQLLKRATKQMRREQKATVTLAVVLVVFLCCWVPFFALHLSNALCLLSGGQQCVHLLAMFLSTWLGYLNSSLNPLIYTVFDKRFRKAFRDLLACCLGPVGAGGGGGGLSRTRARR